MPAHQGVEAIGEKKLSDGSRLSPVDWRANRLADALAKMAAADYAMPLAIQKVLDSACVAVRHAASLLACVTHVANNHKELVHDDGGNTHWVTRRDSQTTQWARTRTNEGPATKRPKTTATDPIGGVKPWTEAEGQPKRDCRKRKLSTGATASQTRFLQRRVDELGAMLAPNPNKRPAADRLRELTLRVKSRLNNATPAG